VNRFRRFTVTAVTHRCVLYSNRYSPLLTTQGASCGATAVGFLFTWIEPLPFFTYSDRYSPLHSLLKGIGRRGATAIGFLFTWIGACLVPLTRTRAQFIGINCCIKSIVEGPFTLIYIYAGELYPSSHRGTAVAFCNSFGRIGEWAGRECFLGGVWRRRVFVVVCRTRVFVAQQHGVGGFWFVGSDDAPVLVMRVSRRAMTVLCSWVMCSWVMCSWAAAMIAPVLLMRVFKTGGGSDSAQSAMLWCVVSFCSLDVMVCCILLQPRCCGVLYPFAA